VRSGVEATELLSGLRPAEISPDSPSANIAFDDLRALLLRLGFEERTRGSHHIFRRSNVEERINLQREGSQAKPYQVRQVRLVILRYRLGELPNA
jgi:predicted RNA binding protein YcfA (HicA-like mRNA interferase family)